MADTSLVKKRAKLGRWIAFIAVLLILAGYGLYTLRVNVSGQKYRDINDYQPWKSEVIEAASDIAVQDGGRIKPFSTWAGFAMLNLHGDRGMKIKVKGEKVKIGPEAFVLDCFFRPELAKQLPIFRIDDWYVIKSLSAKDVPAGGHGMHAPSEEELAAAIKEVTKDKKRRDRYSYNELEPIAPVLLATSQSIRKKTPSKEDMTASQRKTVDLAEQVWLFMQLVYHMDFVRADIPLKEGTSKEQADQMRRMSYWIKAFPALAEAVRQMNPRGERLPQHLRDLFSDLELRMRRASEDIKIFPPYGDDPLWMPMGKRIDQVVKGNRTHVQALTDDMVMLEDANIALRDQGQLAFAKKLTDWKNSVHSRIGTQAAQKLATEVRYSHAHYFYRALLIFLFAFLFIMTSWLAPRSKWATISTWIATFLCICALLLMAAGITHRCIIMERSPVGNLYDTILFIGSTGVLILLLVEWMTRRRVMLGLAIFMGLVCMFVARRYEIGDGKDHMDPLVAVLKSNFWLSTHVVTVTMGYMGGLAAAGVSALYLFARVLGIDEQDKKWRRAITRIAYGMICFTLFFSLIGTVLGGIWANDSWGRFWGWDPKENGALMIVLWCLALLHARLAGYLREWGLHIATVFGAAIVAFSWWHVNMLGEGLHSYGFTDGKSSVIGFYYIILAICLMGGIAAIVDKVQTEAKKNLSNSQPKPTADEPPAQ